MNLKSKLSFFLLVLLIPFSAPAAEYSDGYIRLVLDEATGRFTLFSHNGTGQRRPFALFADQDARTSFLSVMINDRAYKMGDTSAFRTRVAGGGLNPSFIFESSFLSVTEEFSFVKEPNSLETNGITIKITLENRGDRQINAGARFLIDTNLSESSGISFSTNRRTISSETLLSKADGDIYWTDRNDRASLSGSLYTGSPGDPDSVHFANWKKLNDVSWTAPYERGRNFNLPPYSLRDSALCYYYESRPLGRGEKRSFGFTLALSPEFAPGFPGESGAASEAELQAAASGAILDMREDTAAGSPVPADSKEHDLAEIRELLARIDSLISSGTATEEELNRLEIDLNRLRAKYSPGADIR